MTETTTTPIAPEPQKIDLPADASWPARCYQIIRAHGGVATKRQINAALEGHPKTEGRTFWREAVSRTVQYDKRLVRAERGSWALREVFSPEELERLDAQRASECPKHGPRKKA
jgi:hypothetical protein